MFQQSLCLQSNVTGLSGDNRWMTRSINKILNRLIEVAVPRIFDLNQRMFNYAINNVVVPRINKILTMYSVIMPSTKLSGGKKKGDVVYLRQLDDATVIKSMKENNVTYSDDPRILNKLLDEKYFISTQSSKQSSLAKIRLWLKWQHSSVARVFQSAEEPATNLSVLLT